MSLTAPACYVVNMNELVRDVFLNASKNSDPLVIKILSKEAMTVSYIFVHA